jgi:hypothetical protein
MAADSYLQNILGREAVDTGIFSPVRNVQTLLNPLIQQWAGDLLVPVWLYRAYPIRDLGCYDDESCPLPSLSTGPEGTYALLTEKPEIAAVAVVFGKSQRSNENDSHPDLPRSARRK